MRQLSTDKLTKIQSQALQIIHRTIENTMKPPTLRELCRMMGYSAVGSAQDIVESLRRKGYLTSEERRCARSLLLTDKGKMAVGASLTPPHHETLLIPMLGRVPAGAPVEAIEYQEGHLRINTSILPKPRPKSRDLFALQATGLSMIGAGILDGDWLIVKSTEIALPGSIVVARLGEDVTVKRLMKDELRGWYLKPENSDFQNIYPTPGRFSLIGLVVALQRTVQNP